MSHTPARLLLTTLVAVLATACGSSGSSGADGDGRLAGPTHDALVAKADLDPCPESSAEAVDDGLPKVTLPCLGDGPPVHLAGLTGTPTVVNVWAAWCIPCQKEAAALSTAFNALQPKVRFLGVDTADDAGSALDFGTHVTPPVRYPSVFDPDKKVLLGLAKAPGPPETAFVDASGAVVHVHVGPYRDAAALRADIAKYLHVK